MGTPLLETETKNIILVPILVFFVCVLVYICTACMIRVIVKERERETVKKTCVFSYGYDFFIYNEPFFS